MAVRNCVAASPGALDTAAMARTATSAVLPAAAARRPLNQGAALVAAYAASTGSPSDTAKSVACHSMVSAPCPDTAMLASCSGHHRPTAANARAMPRSPRGDSAGLQFNWAWSEPANHNRVALGKKLPRMVNRPCMGLRDEFRTTGKGRMARTTGIVWGTRILGARGAPCAAKSVNKVVDLGPATLRHGRKTPSDRAHGAPTVQAAGSRF